MINNSLANAIAIHAAIAAKLVRNKHRLNLVECYQK